MDKIIIEVGEYKVTVNTVEEAQRLMGMVKKEKTPKVDSDEHVIPIRKGKASHSHRWTKEEVQYMAENLKTASLASLSRDSKLLKNHSAGGIQMMGWKINTNTPKLKLKPELQAVVDSFQEWKDNQ